MRRRRIGQERLFQAPANGSSLDEIAKLIDWAAIECKREADPLLAGLTR